MPSWSNPITLPIGAVLPSTYYNTVVNNEIFLYQCPYASIFNSVSTSVPNAADTPVTLGGITFLGYGWSVASNNLVVPLTGIYQVNFRISTSTSGTAGHFAQLFHNGASYLYGSWCAYNNTNPSPQSTGSGLVSCTAGDTLGLVAYQNCGSTVTTVADNASTAIDAFFVGSQ